MDRIPTMTFRPAHSTTRDVDIIEVWWGDKFIATITPLPNDAGTVAVTIVSNYLGNAVFDFANEPPVVAVTFHLDPG